ncbi:phosphotransferase family protein [Nonomuraea soli]|uniref:Aminoglycoside phosphotransferase domain-containing protein n=1 Tax=Nonomuraea soli TaxID=1032476 RepID=A0A7W0CH98_9ACTN|nr:phosphotransferase [Nonomuraea soli]MBA2891150.1 hypothetical protein [Nonomuraea soli]
MESVLGARVVDWVPVRPWAVARVLLDDGRRVVVKGDRGVHRTAGRPEREAAALRLLAEGLGVVVAPGVLAAGSSWVVMEDLSPRVALDGLIRRDGVGPHRGRLEAFARVLGTLGAVSAGRVSSFGPREWPPAGLPAGLLEAGVALEGAALREFGLAVGVLAEPGPFEALSHGDAEANNVLVCALGEPDERLIDFELSGRAHAVLDAVGFHVPGPAWMAVGGAGEVYRRALAAGVAQAEDDRVYGEALGAACLMWAVARLRRWPVLDGRPAGDDSRVQLVSTLEAAAGVAQVWRVWPALSGWAWRVSAWLRRRWADADVDVAALAPYTVRRG